MREEKEQKLDETALRSVSEGAARGCPHGPGTTFALKTAKPPRRPPAQHRHPAPARPSALAQPPRPPTRPSAMATVPSLSTAPLLPRLCERRRLSLCGPVCPSGDGSPSGRPAQRANPADRRQLLEEQRVHVRPLMEQQLTSRDAIAVHNTVAAATP